MREISAAWHTALWSRVDHESFPSLDQALFRFREPESFEPDDPDHEQAVIAEWQRVNAAIERQRQSRAPQAREEQSDG